MDFTTALRNYMSAVEDLVVAARAGIQEVVRGVIFTGKTPG